MQWSPSGRRLLLLLVVHVASVHNVFPLYQWVVWDPPVSWLEEEEEVEEDEEVEVDYQVKDQEEVEVEVEVQAAGSWAVDGDSGGGRGGGGGGDSGGGSGGGGGRGGGDESGMLEVQTEAVEEAEESAMGCGTLSCGRWHTPSAHFSQDCLPIFEQYAQTHSLWNPTEDAVAYPAHSDVENTDHIEVQHFPPRQCAAGGAAGGGRGAAGGAAEGAAAAAVMHQAGPTTGVLILYPRTLTSVCTWCARVRSHLFAHSVPTHTHICLHTVYPHTLAPIPS
jgi:hypothetical protein